MSEATTSDVALAGGGLIGMAIVFGI